MNSIEDGAKLGSSHDHGKVYGLLGQFGVYVVVVVLVIAGSLVSKKFDTWLNIASLLQSIAILGIVSAGVAFVTYSGNFADMSVPAAMALPGIIAIGTIQYGIVACIVLGLFTGILIGVVNGVVVGKYGANPIIWTLAINYVIIGMMEWIWGGGEIYPYNLSGLGQTTWPIFEALARYEVWGRIPLSVLVFLLVAVALYIVIHKSKYGFQLKMVGASKSVAMLTGVNVARIVTIAFVISSVMSALGGIFLTSLNMSGLFDIGSGYDFNSLTAVVIGGVTLVGGRGNMIGVVGGVLIIGLITNILNFLGMSVFAQHVVEGAVFILVVTFYSVSNRRRGEVDA